MQTVNAQLLDAAISHQIDIEHYSNGVVRRIIALLNRVDSDLFAQIQRVLDDMEGQTFTVQRLEKLLESVRALNAQAYESIGKELAGELKALTEYEVGYQHQLFSSVLPVQVSVVSVPPKQVYAAAMARPFQGRMLREWLDGLEESRAAKVRDAIRIGYVEGETNQQIITRIRGTKALNYADGLLDISRRDAEAIVRTSVAHTANYSRQHFMEANTDIIKGVKWIATLDSRTTPVCRARDGKIYPVDSGPRPPAHIRCRSSISPVTKSWKELGIDLPEKDVGTRASMDGHVPGDMNYADWLAKKPAAFQDEVLGATRGRLFRDGKMPLTSFVNNAGREYTLDELRKRDAAAFKRAGL